MADATNYKYCLTCHVRYKNKDIVTCPKCGGNLSDTPTGATSPAGAPPPVAPPPVAPPVAPPPVTSPSGTAETETRLEERDSWSVKDVMLCLLHQILSGIPVVGLIWCCLSYFKNPLKGRVTKGTIIAGIIGNILALVLLIVTTLIK